MGPLYVSSMQLRNMFVRRLFIVCMLACSIHHECHSNFALYLSFSDIPVVYIGVSGGVFRKWNGWVENIEYVTGSMATERRPRGLKYDDCDLAHRHNTLCCSNRVHSVGRPLILSRLSTGNDDFISARNVASYGVIFVL